MTDDTDTDETDNEDELPPPLRAAAEASQADADAYNEADGSLRTMQARDGPVEGAEGDDE